MQNAAQLLDNSPSRGRALAEAGLVLVTVFLPANLAVLGRMPLLAVSLGLLAWGFALLRPWTHGREGRWGRALGSSALLVLALGAATASHWFTDPPVPPARLGVRHTLVTPGGGEPGGRAVLELTQVTPGLPAEGRLEVGDRVLAVDGTPLATEDTELDFQTRVREAGDGASTTLRLTVERQGVSREVEVPVGPTRGVRPFQPGTLVWLCVRALGMCLLVALLVWRDGQGPAQVGLVREGLGRELLWGVPIAAATYAVHIAATLPLAAIAALLKLTGQETLARKEVALALVETGLGVPAFAAMMVLVTGFEELAFRGFLVPRMRTVLGHWGLAVGVSAALFGMGHVYEGTLAVFQTAVLGAWFGFVFIHRFRLPSVMVAHAAFNTFNFALMLWLQRSGLLEKLTQQRLP